jgi:pSer/pThr/pTyr-binding forkhead associated (FHA) protein
MATAQLQAPPRTVVIGRGGDSDFVIGDRTVSRRHAALHRAGPRWILEDLGSKNGTRVNGGRVGGWILIEPGDQLGFGAATAVFDPDDRRLFSKLRIEEPDG